MISEDFLKKEIRDGFEIPSLMKRTWAAELKMLTQLQDFFKAYNLTYYAEVGTLLGAARHHGFVPWDDDIDIAMPREDYMRLQALSDELPESLRLKSMYVQDDFLQLHSVISNSRETKLTWDTKRMDEYYGCPFIIGIDVFPMDYIAPDSPERQILRLRGQMLHKMAFLYDEVFSGELKEEEIQQYEKELQVVEEHFGVQFDYEISLKRQLLLLYEDIITRCPEADAEFFDYSPRFVLPEAAPIPIRRKEWYEKTRELPFEMTEVTVPSAYETTLDTMYGEWRVPVMGLAAHEYPFYKGQVEYFTYAGHGEELARL